jgi:hypothetical protein
MKAVISFQTSTGSTYTAELYDINSVDSWCEVSVSTNENYLINVYRNSDGRLGCNIHYVHNSGHTDLFRFFPPASFSLD